MTKIERFDGAAVWRTLSAADQAAIGAITLELFVAWYFAEDDEDPDCEVRSVHSRAAATSLDILTPRFQCTISDVLTAGSIRAADGTPRLPSMMGPICSKCGCSNRDGCSPSCFWVSDDLCSACAPEGAV